MTVTIQIQVELTTPAHKDNAVFDALYAMKSTRLDLEQYGYVRAQVYVDNEAVTE